MGPAGSRRIGAGNGDGLNCARCAAGIRLGARELSPAAAVRVLECCETGQRPPHTLVATWQRIGFAGGRRQSLNGGEEVVSAPVPEIRLESARFTLPGQECGEGRHAPGRPLAVRAVKILAEGGEGLQGKRGAVGALREPGSISPAAAFQLGSGQEGAGSGQRRIVGSQIGSQEGHQRHGSRIHVPFGSEAIIPGAGKVSFLRLPPD